MRIQVQSVETSKTKSGDPFQRVKTHGQGTFSCFTGLQFELDEWYEVEVRESGRWKNIEKAEKVALPAGNGGESHTNLGPTGPVVLTQPPQGLFDPKAACMLSAAITGLAKAQTGQQVDGASVIADAQMFQLFVGGQLKMGAAPEKPKPKVQPSQEHVEQFRAWREARGLDLKQACFLLGVDDVRDYLGLGHTVPQAIARLDQIISIAKETN